MIVLQTLNGLSDAEAVEALERQYDAVTAGRASGLSDDLPSADELAAEVEKFLAGQDEDNPPGS